ncbi:MAG: histidine kinase dimerization/phospho-acceptor domain-containing protein [Chthonomonadales bacterium]
MAALLDAITIRLYAVDREARLLYAEGPLDPFTGLDSGATAPYRPLGGSLLSLLPATERQRWQRVIRSALASNEGEPLELVVSRVIKGKEPLATRYVQISVRHLRAGNDTEGVVFICREAPAWLLDQSAAGTAPGEDARRLDLARQFAATLNHEINNPLFVVSATLEDLMAEAQDPDAVRRLQTALDSTWRVAEAVKKLQEIKRIVSTPYIPGCMMVDLNASSEAE